MRRVAILSLGAAFLLSNSAVFAEDRLVPGQYGTIEAAISAAGNGDRVIISPGLYNTHDLDFGGKAITVQSTDPNNWAVVETTVIDCGDLGRGFYFHNGETGSSVLAGLTMTDGNATNGGAVSCEASSPTITKCVFSSNYARYGGAIDNENSSPTITNCIFTDNTAEWYGGAIDNYESSPAVKNCVFSQNTAVDWGCGGAIDNEGSSADITGCTFYGNTADYGGAIYNSNSSTTVSNCILWSDSAPDGPEMYGDCTVSYSDVEGGLSGTGNIDADPCFADAAGGDFHLLYGSPCINSGNPAYSPAPDEIDIDGEQRVMGILVDMGADEFPIDKPIFRLWPSQFEFFAGAGGPNPAPQILSIRNIGGDTLNWQITDVCPWLQASPSSGQCAGEVNEVALTVNLTGLGAGPYYCQLTVSDPCAFNSPQRVDIYLTIRTDTNGLVSWWEFDEDQGPIASDSFGSNDGTIYGATWTSGMVGGSALSFDGVGDYVDCGNDESLQIDVSNGISLVAWICPRSLDLDERIISSPRSFGSIRYVLGGWDSGKIAAEFVVYDVHQTQDVVITPDAWKHVAATYDGSAIRIFVNGEEQNVEDPGPGHTGFGWWGETVWIGGRQGASESFKGRIDDVRIYDLALSGDRIRRLYREGTGNKAFDPNPADGSTGNELDVILSWSPGIHGAWHDVYFGTSFPDVNDATTNSAAYMGRQSVNNWDSNNYDSNGLEYATTYYWRIDDVTASAPNSPWKGTIWSFETGSRSIELSALEFGFVALEGGANPPDQILSISNNGVGTLDWEITAGCAWLSIEPNSGSSTAETDDVTLSVDISGLAAGIYACNLTISDPNAQYNPQVVAVTLYVTATGDGLLVPSQYGTIQAAIDAALNGDTVTVAPGTYTGEGNRDLDFGGKRITVRSTDPNNPAVVAATVINCSGSQSDPHCGFYFRSGEGQASVVSGLTITNGYVYDNPAVGGGIYCRGSSPTIEKCVITGNTARGRPGIPGDMYPDCGCDPDGADAFGGGISCSAYSHPSLINCTISNNSSIGGEGVGSDWLCSCGVGSGGDGYGGGVFCDSNSSATLIECTLIYNQTRGGNGLDGNPSWAAGHGGVAYGGAVYCAGESFLVDCHIADNAVAGGSGGSHHYGPGGAGGKACGGGVCFDAGGSGTITASMITNNAATGGPTGTSGYPRSGPAGCGAGIYAAPDSVASVRQCQVTGNVATGGNGSNASDVDYAGGAGGAGRGGGICFDTAAWAEIENCLLNDNEAIGGQGGFGVSAPGGSGGNVYGGGLYFDCASPSSIKNCVVARNTLSGGTGGNGIGGPGGSDGTAYGRGIYSGGGNTAITDCILWHNFGDDVDGSGYSVTYSCTEQIISGTGNIHDDPCFVSGPEGDYYLSQVAAGQALDSPCVDAGSDTAVRLGMDTLTTRTDQVGDDGIVDMGYHYPIPISSSTCWDANECAGQIAGDATCDGNVDLADLFALKTHFGKSAPWLGSECCADFDQDGSVNLGDLFILKANFGSGSYSPSTGNQNCPP